MLIEDIHFILESISLEDLGRKAIAVNLSDIAAMGGQPLHGAISIAIPKEMAVAAIEAIYRGMKSECQKYGVNIIGGDTCSCPEKLVINVCIIGEAHEDEVLYRKGAKPGDDIYVTGTLGDSEGGLKLLFGEAYAPERTASVLREAHSRPYPFLEAGRVTARSKLAGSMIDISDGLISDLRHICDRSGVGARLSQSALPLSDELRLLAQINDLDPYELALYGGEDYRLLITVPEKNREAFEALFRNGKPCHVYRIGEIIEKEGLKILLANGNEKILKIRGYDHFKAGPF